jgi:pimeloyl-ACP methyl ester carboxylesterase
VHTTGTFRWSIALRAAVVMMAAAGMISCSGSSSAPDASPATTAGPTTTTSVPPEYETPIVFVHGFMGTAAQYRSVALRFTSNGFPANRIRGFDYGTGEPGSRPDPTSMLPTAGQVGPDLKTFLDGVRKEFNVPKVRLVGHSLGTFVLSSFMKDPANAGIIDKWVLVDGVPCPEGDASCLEIRAAAMGQTHVEASTSPESFAKQYAFFIGREPKTTKIEADPPDHVEIAGKVLNLQSNTAPVGGTGDFWEIDPSSGARVGSSKAESFTVGADGSWGPFKVNGTKHYEIAVSSKPGGKTLHFYLQPFIRSDYLVRLITAPEDSYTAVNTNSGPNHSTVVVSRYREWWVSKGDKNDSLEIGETGQPPVDVLKPLATGPCSNSPGGGCDGTIGIHVHDDKATPGQTTSVLLDAFKGQGFQSGVDIFLPAATPPTSTITVTNVPRGDRSKIQTLAAPNWASSTDAITFEFNDYVQ